MEEKSHLKGGKSLKANSQNRFMKPQNLAILISALGLAFFLQIYRQFIFVQFRNFGAILPGHIPQPDIGRNIYELIESRGFKAERHFVTNPKGYILQLTRIVNPHIKDRSKLRPVLLHHGFQCSGTLYIITNRGQLKETGEYVEFDSEGKVRTGPHNTLGFMLAVNDYDVWLAHYRGSTYSSNHTELSTDESKFWNFTIDDLIEDDYPVLIDHVLKHSKSKTLGYIGHSLGNFMMFSLLSKHPQYSQVIKPFVALSPVFYLNELTTPVANLRYLKSLLRRFPSAFIHIDALRAAYSTLCSNRYALRICHRVFRFMIGLGEKNIDIQRLGVYMDNLPMGSGGVLASQIAQALDYGPTMFDFGDTKLNLQHYNSEVPPFYDASKINSTDIALVYTKDDWFNPLINIRLLKKNLNVPLMGDLLTPDPTWGHLELLWSDKAGEVVNVPVLNWLNKYRHLK